MPGLAATTSTSTTTTSTTSTTTMASTPNSHMDEIQEHTTDVQPNAPVDLAPDTASPTASGGHLPSHPYHPASTNNQQQQEMPSTDKDNANTKETIGDLVELELENVKSAARRSVPLMTPKVKFIVLFKYKYMDKTIVFQTAETLLRHRGDGQYSSFDMAQYVYWTGDEAGVARAVEEFIEQGLVGCSNMY